MTTKQLEQIFNDNSDCYADTWEDSGGEMHNGCHMMREGESISAMTLPKFIEVVSKLSQPPIDNKAVDDEAIIAMAEKAYPDNGLARPSYERTAYIKGAKDMINAITNPTKTKQPAKIAGH